MTKRPENADLQSGHRLVRSRRSRCRSAISLDTIDALLIIVEAELYTRQTGADKDMDMDGGEGDNQYQRVPDRISRQG